MLKPHTVWPPQPRSKARDPGRMAGLAVVEVVLLGIRSRTGAGGQKSFPLSLKRPGFRSR
ncbi:MAG: hypothetical protein Q9177_001025 [Variospora cf. flavescens]